MTATTRLDRRSKDLRKTIVPTLLCPGDPSVGSEAPAGPGLVYANTAASGTNGPGDVVAEAGAAVEDVDVPIQAHLNARGISPVAQVF